MQSQQATCLSTYSISRTPTDFLISNKRIKKSLRIKLNNLTITEEEMDPSFMTSANYSYFIGIFESFSSFYAVFVHQCQQVAQIAQLSSIYRVKSVEFIPLDESIDDRDSKPIIANLKKYLSLGFTYFSDSRNIALSLQRSFKENKKGVDYAWNNNLNEFLTLRKVSTNWINSVIQGFVEQFKNSLVNEQVTVILISRISATSLNTEYWGLFDNGEVSPLVETEMIVQYMEYVTSYLAVRGAAPVFWNGQQLLRKIVLQKQSFVQHFERVCTNYKQVICINLLSQTIKSEKQLSEHFSELIDMDHGLPLKIHPIDYLQIVKYNKMEQLTKEIRTFDNLIYASGFLCLKLSSIIEPQVEREQEILFRINCSDCMEKSNLIMMKIFFINFERILISMGHKISEHLKKIECDEILRFLEMEQNKSRFGYQIKALWNSNCDQLNLFFQGSKSNIGDSKQGKKNSFSSFFNSLERLYHNQFEASQRIEASEYLLFGINSKRVNQVDTFMANQHMKFSEYSKILMHVVTWNVAATQRQSFDLNDQIIQFEQVPDIFVLGLQEIVELNPKNVVGFPQEKAVHMWDHCVSTGLAKYGKNYVRIEVLSLVGLFLTVYAHRSIIHRVSDLQTDILKTGFQGTLGNKGALLIRFKIDDTDFVICNCHLSAGQTKTKYRIQEFDLIHEKAFIAASTPKASKKQPRTMIESDHKIFFGDMNFRLNLTFEEVIQITDEINQTTDSKIKSQGLQRLAEKDQLIQSKNQSKYLLQYSEAPITFLPTYKFEQEIGSNQYTVKKKRVPSYCDRILFSSSENLKVQQLEYRRGDRYESDHKPVIAQYQFEVRKIDQTKKYQVKEEYYDFLTNNKGAALEEALNRHRVYSKGNRQQVFTPE